MHCPFINGEAHREKEHFVKSRIYPEYNPAVGVIGQGSLDALKAGEALWESSR